VNTHTGFSHFKPLTSFFFSHAQHSESLRVLSPPPHIPCVKACSIRSRLKTLTLFFTADSQWRPTPLSWQPSYWPVVHCRPPHLRQSSPSGPSLSSSNGFSLGTRKPAPAPSMVPTIWTSTLGLVAGPSSSVSDPVFLYPPAVHDVLESWFEVSTLGTGPLWLVSGSLLFPVSSPGPCSQCPCLLSLGLDVDIKLCSGAFVVVKWFPASSVSSSRPCSRCPHLRVLVKSWSRYVWTLTSRSVAGPLSLVNGSALLQSCLPGLVHDVVVS
jgi:hypothetical protein